MTTDQQIDAFASLLRQYRAIAERRIIQMGGDTPKLNRLRTLYRLWAKDRNAMRLQYLLHNAQLIEAFFSALSTVFGEPETTK